MALLLEVSRGQISMYEIGKRSLPTAALQKLATIPSYLRERETLASKHLEPVNQKLLEECRAVYEREKELEAYQQRKEK